MPLPALLGLAARGAGAASSVLGSGEMANASGELQRLSGLASQATGLFTQTLTVFVSGLERAARPIEQLVRIANPAQADAFNRAIRDAYAVIGRSLIPVMQSFTKVARQVGDTMAGLEPVFKPAIASMARLVEVMGNELNKSIRDNIYLFESLSVSLIRVGEAITYVIEQANKMQPPHSGEIASAALLGPLGIGGRDKIGKFDPNASGVGAAARQASFIQPKQLSDDMIKNALNMGVGQKETKSETYLGNIWDSMKQLVELARKSQQGKAGSDAVTGTANDLDTRWAATWAGF